MKTAPKRAIQKIVEATGDLIGNKISDKITSASKNLLDKLQNNEANNKIEMPKGRYVSPEKDNKLLMN